MHLNLEGAWQVGKQYFLVHVAEVRSCEDNSTLVGEMYRNFLGESLPQVCHKLQESSGRQQDDYNYHEVYHHLDTHN